MARRKNILYVSCDSFKNTVTMFIVYSHYSVLLNVAMCMMLTHFGHVQLFITLLTVAHQAPLSMGFSKQEDWSGLPCPPPGDLPDPGIILYHLSHQRSPTALRLKQRFLWL